MSIDVSSQEQKLQKSEYANRQLGIIIDDIFGFLDNTILWLRVILYAGSVAAAWFYLNDKVLSVGITASLAVSHVLIAIREYIEDKRKNMSELRKG